ncbi:hypothetical protein C8T65DRAFT_698961 [Cerioporus squamosus]|nr:hypothetical protein C8T65DRAFT_698961 [Cerioporus squamosus]
MSIPCLHQAPLMHPSSTRGGSQRDRRSGYDPSRPLFPDREDWRREQQKGTDRPVLFYSERPKKNKRREDDLHNKIATNRKYVAEVVQSPVDMSRAESTKTGWAGKDYRYRADRASIDKAWREGTIGIVMKNMMFKTLFHSNRTMYLVDGKGTAFGLVTDIPAWMYKPEVVWGGRNFLEQVPCECIGYRDRCGDRTEADINANSRGPHWYNVAGVDRQIKGAPGLTSHHVDHMKETTDMLQKHTAIYRLITYASSILKMRFPSLADRVDRCAQKLAEQGWEHAMPMFGYWYNFCINCPRPNSNLGVSTLPHVDGKNLALMVCAVFVWGKFNSKEKAFLVLWEARLIIELPVGVLILYPSSLFIHFNIDLSTLHVVTTQDGSLPTPANSTPLQNVEGRGSIVMFNQASMFQLAELGCTVKEAQQAGKTSTCDNSGHVSCLPVP